MHAERSALGSKPKGEQVAIEALRLQVLKEGAAQKLIDQSAKLRKVTLPKGLLGGALERTCRIILPVMQDVLTVDDLAQHVVKAPAHLVIREA